MSPTGVFERGQTPTCAAKAISAGLGGQITWDAVLDAAVAKYWQRRCDISRRRVRPTATLAGQSRPEADAPWDATGSRDAS